MRYRMMIAALLAAVPAAAAPDTNAFLRKCRADAPVATCTCVVEKLKQSTNGQITLDVFRLMEMPQDQQKALAIELANKYETTLSGIKAAIDSTKSTFDTAAKDCL